MDLLYIFVLYIIIVDKNCVKYWPGICHNERFIGSCIDHNERGECMWLVICVKNSSRAQPLSHTALTLWAPLDQALMWPRAKTIGDFVVLVSTLSLSLRPILSFSLPLGSFSLPVVSTGLVLAHMDAVDSPFSCFSHQARNNRRTNGGTPRRQRRKRVEELTRITKTPKRQRALRARVTTKSKSASRGGGEKVYLLTTCPRPGGESAVFSVLGEKRTREFAEE